MKILLFIFTLFASVPVFSQNDVLAKDIQKALDELNNFRKMAGVPPVKISESLSEGCNAHAKYLVWNKNSEKVADIKAHEEYEDLRGFTLKGKDAGGKSVIHFVKPSEAVPGWINTFFHRIPLLQPNLKEIGLGYYVEDGYEVCLIQCDVEPDTAATPAVVLFPPADMVNVPGQMQQEIPSPLPDTAYFNVAGYPITITFCADQLVENAVFELRDSKHHIVRCYVTSPRHPAIEGYQQNTICGIPVDPLERESKYFVSVSCKVNGRPFKKQYSFTTSKEFGWSY